MNGLVLLVGPTGAGKTALALALAAQAPVEVVSLDSVQVYRGLDIGSAKPTASERARLRHHVIDVADPDERFTAADWLERCEAAVADIRARGRVPLVVGGTGLYCRLLETGLAPLPEADEGLRAALHAEELAAPGALHARLAAIDPRTAERLSPRDRVRVIRALEVHRLSGRPLSEHLAEHAASRAARRLDVFLLEPSDAALRASLHGRAEAMLSAGLIAEARGLRERFGPVRPLEAVGYKEALQLVDGRFHASELTDRIVQASRQFARRQRTWWRKLVAAERAERAEALLPRLAARIAR